MAATRQDIEGWFDRGVKQKSRHMIVVCDSFDYDDYPVFTTTDDECLQRYKNPGEMQRVREVYDLRADKAEQMNERRAMRLPEAANDRVEGRDAASSRRVPSHDGLEGK
jgi:hypothetical protein